MIAADRAWRNGCLGFSYVFLLFMVALTGWALAGVAQVWHTLTLREKETELLFVGNQFKAAIESYYRASPGVSQYPQSLDDLLQDNRFPNVRRHLRKIFVDPMTGKAQWGVQRQGGVGILGVYSLADGVPIKQENFASTLPNFAGATSYRDWIFAFRPSGPDQVATAALTPESGVAAAAKAPRAPATIESPAIASPAPSPEDTEQRRKAQERLCSIQQRSDNDTCRVAEQQHGSQMLARCTASAQRRYRGCLDATPDAALPLDTDAY